MPSVSQITSLKTNINSFGGNIISIPGSSGVRNKVSSSNLGGFGDNSIDKFYQDLSELKLYRNAKICKTIVGILSEYVIKFRSKSNDLVTITENGVETPESVKLNQLFRTINLQKLFFDDKLKDYIYYGSQLILIKVPKSGDIEESVAENLRYSFSSIVHEYKNLTEFYVNGELLDLRNDRYFYLPLRIGSLNLQLDEPNQGSFQTRTDELIQTESWLASEPLFHGNVIELKLFILKDILTQLIQIQDIVSPNLLLTNVDKNTSQEKATELAEQIETLINQYGDLTQLIASNADITTLSQFILNNVRVYPDMLGVINGTNKLDFSRLTGKNNEVRNELENTESQLVNAIGIPIDLYRGNSTNKFDALKQSDRLLSTVVAEMNSIDSSVREFCLNYLDGIGKLNKDTIVECNIFDYSFIEGINSSYKYETSNQYIRNMVEFVSGIKDTISSTKGVLNSEKLYNYLVKKAEMIYPGVSDLLDENLLEKLENQNTDEQDKFGESDF